MRWWGFKAQMFNPQLMFNRITKAQNMHESPTIAKPMLGDVFSPRIEVADNIEFMQTIESKSIDLIYCDVLYGTGRNFGEYQDLKPNRTEIENHYIPRIKEMHRILKDTGSIYLQMDCKISHWVRIICDDIFGYQNFKNELYYYNNVVKNNVKLNFQNSTDTILFYTVSNNYTFNPQYENVIKESTLKEYKYNDVGELVRMARTRDYKNKGKTKVNLENYKGRLTNNVIDICHNLKADYPTQKPKELLKRLILSVTNENDLVADFYLGSGTTAVVCKELNRRFVGCDVNPNAVKITNERLNGTLF